jgi:TonB-dependent SusC/RagA subfamily outer membrane receptor
VNVLKGAAAAALYGSRAANGVIVITTKKGSSARGRVDIVLNSSYSIQKATGLPELQNEYGQGLNGLYNPASANSWGPKFGSTPTLSNGLLLANGTTIDYRAYPNNIKDYFTTGSILENTRAALALSFP